MATRNQANSIAEALLAQERARSATRLNRSYWDFPELEAIEPERRALVVREARRAVARNWVCHLVALNWVLAYALTWGFLIPAGDKHGALPVFALGATVPVPFFYGAWTRRQVRRIARSVAVSPSASSGSLKGRESPSQG
jgi:hypothetical protein